jgi:hypothetical protein
MLTASDTAAVISQSNPAFVPSRSIDGQQDLAGAAIGGFARPLDGVAVRHCDWPLRREQRS